MKSTKCPQCGLVYWMTEPKCKRCGMTTMEPSAADPYPAQPQYQPQYAQQPMQVMNFAEDAAKAKLLKHLKADSIFFYFVGGMQVGLWFFMGHLLIVDGFLNIGLSFLVHKFKSRVAAIFLLGLTLLGLLFGLLAIALLGARAGVILPIALIVRVLSAARMVYTTFKLKGYVEEGPMKWLPPPPPDFQSEDAPQWTPPDPSPQWQPSQQSL